MSSFTQKQQDISNWFRSVCEVKVGDVTANHPAVLGLDHRTPVSKALEVLEDVEIQSVAVYGPANSFVGAGGVEIVAEDKQYVGIVSILDILAFSLKNEDFLGRNISDVIGSTNESLSLWSEDSHKPLYFALEQFVKGVHHSLVRDSADSKVPLKYLAQTDIVRYLLTETDTFPHLRDILSQPVQVATTKNVASVYLSTPITEAIELLVEWSALPVLSDDSGAVVSHLSAADFKRRSTSDVHALPGATVYDLLHHQTDDMMMLHVPLTVRNDSTLHEAAYKMLANHIHRLWVVSPASNEVRLENLGVLTLTDILRAVYIAER